MKYRLALVNQFLGYRPFRTLFEDDLYYFDMEHSLMQAVVASTETLSLKLKIFKKRLRIYVEKNLYIRIF